MTGVKVPAWGCGQCLCEAPPTLVVSPSGKRGGTGGDPIEFNVDSSD